MSSSKRGSPRGRNPNQQVTSDDMKHEWHGNVDEDDTISYDHDHSRSVYGPPVDTKGKKRSTTPKALASSSNSTQPQTPRTASPSSTTATTSQSTSLALAPVSVLTTRSSWLPILESSHQLVLYNPISHALTIAPPMRPPIPVSRNGSLVAGQSGPEGGTFVDNGQQRGLVKRESPGAPQRGFSSTLGMSPERGGKGMSACPWCSRPFNLEENPPDHQRHGTGEEFLRRAPNYFQLLEASFEAQSRPSSPPLIQPTSK
jgi:hypothetical protein